MKRLIKKHVNWTLLIVAITGLIFTNLVYQFERKNYTPEAFTHSIQKTFSKKESILRKYEGVKNVFSILYDLEKNATDNGLYYFIFKNNKLQNWNTNSIRINQTLLDTYPQYAKGKVKKILNENIYLLSNSIPEGNDTFIIFLGFPINYDYAIENQYFQSHFIDNSLIPKGSRLFETPSEFALPIKNYLGQDAFYIQITNNEFNHYQPGYLVIALFVISLFFLFLFVNKICLLIGRKFRPMTGWFITVAIIIIIYFILKHSDYFPFNFRNLELFSPQILASGTDIKSLADLIILTCLTTWSLAYQLIYVPREDFKFTGNSTLNNFILIVLIIIAMNQIYFDQNCNIRLLIFDSKIPFEVSSISSINGFTFVGLFTLTMIAVNIILYLTAISSYYRLFTRNYFWKYITTIIISITLMLLHNRGEFGINDIINLASVIFGLILLDTIGLPIHPLAYFTNVDNKTKAYQWFAVICMLITFEVFYHSYIKEQSIRQVFAERLVQKPDILAEINFNQLSDDVQNDSTIINFLNNPHPKDNIIIKNYIYHNYLFSVFKNFNVNIYLTDKNNTGKTLYDKNEKSVERLTAKYYNYNSENSEKGIYYLANYHETFTYFGNIPIKDKSGEILGYIKVILNRELDGKSKADPLYSTASVNPADQQYFDNYKFAVYKNGKLSYFSDINTFSNSIYKEPAIGDHYFEEKLGSSYLYYKASATETICVLFKRNILINIISLFSYVFALVLLLSLLYYVFQFYLIGRNNTQIKKSRLNITIKAKVNITILLTVFISFVILGTVTVNYLISKYKSNQQQSLLKSISYVQVIIGNMLSNSLLDTISPANFSELIEKTNYAYKVAEISEDQKVPINIYDAYGKLGTTSQNQLLQKGYIAALINPAAFTVLSANIYSEYSQIEKIGSLEYNSIYNSIKNKNGEIIGYINIPYYASKAELNEEVNNILAVLINLYTFIFFISGISALFISNNVIKSFKLLIDQFKNIQLKYNEPIQWPYADEIGMLVKEYNAMIFKVENMATKLANSEREAAWREIAKQVAHEIKNPLTPMKLHIQYLQQAIASDKDNINELTIKVTTVLLEQIDHLTIIASAFSNFAKLPEAAPTRLGVNEAIQSIVDLYENTENATVSFVPCASNIYVWVDKTYFNRIFTNIIQNAIQAIPLTIDGKVEITCNPIDHFVVIAIKDNGVGIDEEATKNMFMPYFTTKSSGTGLGLSMTKSMVELSNGKIYFTTELGKGTTFYIRIPIQHQDRIN